KSTGFSRSALALQIQQAWNKP
ncbi:MAG: hypothetical protein AWT59_2863, partial [Candidatus Gallionella acididurans]